MKKMGYFIGLVILLSASECGKKTVSLAATQWKVLELRQPNATNTLLPTKTYVLEFRDEKSLNLRLDVNNCIGNYEKTDDGKITFTPLGCTKICCDTEFALTLTQMLSSLHTFELKKDTLSLKGEGYIILKRIK